MRPQLSTRPQFGNSTVNITSSPYRPLHPPLSVHNTVVDALLDATELTDHSILRFDAPVTVSSEMKPQGLAVRVEFERLDEFASIRMTTC